MTVMLAVIIGTAILLWYIGKKVVRPFQKMGGMAKELAKGNLTTPVKAEKSRYFGQFLWGVDMLREDFLLLEVNCKEFYLTALVKAIAAYYEEKIKLLHGKLKIDQTEDCLLYGDFDRTVEVLQNICENALKYGDGQWLHLTFAEEEDCRLITVENSGSTLAEEELPHIFDSFYRGSNSENVKGSGLGLYICKNLLHQMDGEIFAKIRKDIFSVTVVLKKM